MAVVKQSTLPTVLKEYMPEYEPCYTQRQEEKTEQKSADQSSCKTDERRVKHGNKNAGTLKQKASKPARVVSPVSTRYKRRSAENEHYENLSASWEVAKSEVKRERHQQLQEKLQLQQHLLRLQNELTEHKRSQADQAQAQKYFQGCLRKDAERSKKQAQQAALQEVCKQSLVQDRRAAASKRRQGRVDPPKEELLSHGDSQKSAPSTPDQKFPPRHRNVSRSPKQPMSPMEELEAEDELEQEQVFSLSGTSSDLDSLPWHHQQLYRLYGEEADYFIHPKIEPKTDEPVAPKIKKSTVEKSISEPPDEGHLGAEKLWRLLRGESNTKLLKEDARFPPELKNAYSSFVRESLTQGRSPVVRNYTATDDVPDMNKLLDQSLLRNIRKYRHKTGIMYRASQANNDRTKILLYNNPLPDITEGDADTISRYMPSWTEDPSETSDPPYMKWLTPRHQKMTQDLELTGSQEDKELSEEQPTEELLAIEGNEPAPAPAPAQVPKEQPQKPKLYFLTERETTIPGEFTERFYKQRKKKDLPEGHARLPSMKAQSSLGFSDHNLSHEGSPEGPSRSESAASNRELLRRYTSDWQPLSMTALVEYKQQLKTAGAGEFQHGRMKMWPNVASMTA